MFLLLPNVVECVWAFSFHSLFFQSRSGLISSAAASVASPLQRGIRLPWGLPWDAVLKPEPPADAAVTEIHGLTVHERAAAYDWLYPVGTALLKGFGRDAARTKRAMEPDVVDAEFDGRPRDASRNRRMRDDHDAVNRPRNGTEIREAWQPLDL